MFSFFRKMAPEVLRGVGRGRGRHKPQTRFLYYEHKSMLIKMAVMMVVINRSFDENGNYEAFWKLLIHWGWNYHWPVWWYDWWWLILDGEGVEQAFQGWGKRWRSTRISAKEKKHPLWWVSMGPISWVTAHWNLGGSLPKRIIDLLALEYVGHDWNHD